MKHLLGFIFLITCYFATYAQSGKSNDTAKKEVIYTYVEQMPIPDYDVNSYLSENLKYPDSAIKNNIEGKVIVKFIVNEDGKISNSTIVKGIGGGCDEESIRVINGMPNWKAGFKNGKPVKVHFTLPVAFKIEDESIYKFVDSMPDPTYNYIEYIKENLKYPETAKKKNVQGNVYLTCIINEEGKITNVKLLNNLESGCNDEAKRLVTNMPAWIPGKFDDKPVKVVFNLFVPFKLDTSTNKNSNSKNQNDDILPQIPYDINNYLMHSLKYPIEARDNNIQGRVIIKMCILENGHIKDYSIFRGVTKSLNDEAYGVMKNMPPWVGGLIEGKPAKTYYTFPINFTLDGNESFGETNKPKDFIFSYDYFQPDTYPVANYNYNKYFEDNVHYPEFAKRNNIQGEVTVLFVVNYDGSIHYSQVITHLDNECDSEAIRVVNNMPHWLPGKYNNMYVNSEYVISVPFYPSIEDKLKAKSSYVYECALIAPTCNYDYKKYISKHLVYPTKAKNKYLKGAVKVKFVVTVTGSIEDVKILEGLGDEYDDEAIRVIKSMPKWNPGIINESPVKVYCTLNVTFIDY